MSSKQEDENKTQSQDESKPRRPSPSIQRLREYRSAGLHETDVPQQRIVPPRQMSGHAPQLKGPYTQQPPMYVGLSRKDLARKNRIQTAILGMGLGTFVVGIYSYTVWKRRSMGINDDELHRLEEEALKMVESGEIDLEALQKQADENKKHRY